MVAHAIAGMVIKLPVGREGGKGAGGAQQISQGKKEGSGIETTLGKQSGPGLVEKNPKHGAKF